MEPWIIIIASFIFALALAYVLIAFYIARSLYHPKRRSLLETHALEDERHPAVMPRYEMWEKETYDVPSRHGYNLKAYFIASPKPSKKYVIIAHGYTYTHHGSIKYAISMRKQNYNVIMYDQPFHGESGGSFTTLGHYEKDDLETMVTHTLATYGEDIILGTYGESMGAATCLLEQAGDDRLDFVVADCGFADLHDLMSYQLRTLHHLPPKLFLPMANVIFRAVTKADIHRIKPIEAVKKSRVPMFFVHGEGDTFIPREHSVRMFEACPTDKDLLIVGDDAEHAQSWGAHTDLYEERLFAFIENVEDSIELRRNT